MVASNQKRNSGIALVGDLPWGSHFCQFYTTKQDMLDIVVPYFRAGLEGNELCVWVTWTSSPRPTLSSRWQATSRALRGIGRPSRWRSSRTPIGT